MSQVEHFDRVAERYDRYRTPRSVTPVHETIVREADLRGKRVVDIGCGTGVNMRFLAESFGCVVAGVDPSERMLAESRRKVPDADLRHGVAERLPFEDSSFDGALMSLVVQHLERPRGFAEACRVLVPGGRLAIATPEWEAFPRAWMAPLFPSYVALEQSRFPSRSALREELPAAGFREVRMIGIPIRRRFSRASAVDRIRGRYASTFDHLSDDEYREGLARAERELPDPVEYVLDLLVVVASK